MYEIQAALYQNSVWIPRQPSTKIVYEYPGTLYQNNVWIPRQPSTKINETEYRIYWQYWDTLTSWFLENFRLLFYVTFVSDMQLWHINHASHCLQIGKI